jgi:hypothetical protein
MLQELDLFPVRWKDGEFDTELGTKAIVCYYLNTSHKNSPESWES